METTKLIKTPKRIFTDEEHRTHIEKIHDMVDGIHELITKLNNDLPARQYQCALMDLESSKIHMQHIYDEGPMLPFVDIPLEQSEVDEPVYFEDSLGRIPVNKAAREERAADSEEAV